MGLGNALAEYQQALNVVDGLDQVLAVRRAASVMAQAIEDHIVGEAMKAGEAGAARRDLPEFVSVESRTGTSARWWCNDCDRGGLWSSPREAFDGSYRHVGACHPKNDVRRYRLR